MSKLTSKKFWMNATERAIKTVCQAAIALIPVNVIITQVDWTIVVGTSLLAGVVSVLTSIATLKTEDDEEVLG